MATTKRHLGYVLGSLLIVALLAGCGGPQVVNVTLTDTAIQTSVNTLPAGPITFHITNVSSSELHEFVIIRTDLNADQLPMGADGNVDEEKLNSPGEKGDIAAGQAGDLTLTLPAGRYMFICNQPGHFKAGMRTEFTITG